MQSSAPGRKSRGVFGADTHATQEFSIEIPDKDADAIHSGKQLHLPNQSIYFQAWAFSHGFWGGKKEIG